VHPRSLGWVGATALAMGGSNQSLFLIAALFVGQGDIPGQGSAAVPLLVIGVLLSWAAAPAWTELVLMWPNRVGGIAAACSEAFRPYSPVLSGLAGTCYWWGWVPTCGLTALLSASAIQQWYVPGLPVGVVASALVALFTVVNLCGIRWVTRLMIPIAGASASLALLASLLPILAGNVDWRQATDFTLTSPFSGWFGDLTSVMAGLYLVGFAAPAFEAATCHVGETINPNRNLPRAMLASAAMAGVYFIVLPVVWLGVLGPEPLGKDLATVLGPVFAPLFGGFGKAAAIWFMMLNMFHGTMQPLAGASRTLAQLSEDGLLPRFLAWHSATDCPWAATLLTAAMSILFLLIGDPIWLIAAANFTYLIAICLPNVATWLLRRDMPAADRPYRAPRGAVGLGLIASMAWLSAAILGFQQFGLPTVLFGLAMAYSGAGLYAWRVIEDRRSRGLPAFAPTLHIKLTGAMLLVLVLDGFGYILAVGTVSNDRQALVAALEDIFVVVALLTVSVGLILPGMIAQAATEVSAAAKRLTSGTLRDFSRAMVALGRGDLESAHASVNIAPVLIRSHDELGEMAASFNLLQQEVEKAALGLDDARESLGAARNELSASYEKSVRLARHDALTSLPNRVAFAEHLAETFESAVTDCTSFAVLCIDLDNFKEINDAFGHAIGDELLSAVSRRLQVAADGAFLARVGGDEFTLVSAKAETRLAVTELADRLLATIEDGFDIQGQRLRVGLSIGIAVFPKDGRETSALLSNADAALYRAKAEGRFGMRFFEPDMDRHLRQRHALQLDLRSAIDRNELLLHFQPQAEIAGGVFGFEALLRWQHHQFGLVPPQTFIPLAEGNGLIVPIGEWVLRCACREAASWPIPLQIAVNLSPVQFQHGDLVGLVHSILFDTGLAPARLELEITEGVLISDPPRALSILRRLKALGVRIAMDDFGIGYASLSSLQSFPFDKIKIDRSFIFGVESNGQSAAIVRAVIGLGVAIGIPVIAEGVETEKQRLFLMNEGCLEMQGYLVGRPAPIADHAELTNGVAAASERVPVSLITAAALPFRMPDVTALETVIPNPGVPGVPAETAETTELPWAVSIPRP
jgi:diguanylate cyclase (GGDEF)-like protein